MRGTQWRERDGGEEHSGERERNTDTGDGGERETDGGEEHRYMGRWRERDGGEEHSGEREIDGGEEHSGERDGGEEHSGERERRTEERNTDTGDGKGRERDGWRRAAHPGTQTETLCHCSETP